MTRSVLVIGAGVSGLSAALELEERGFEATVLERRPFPGGQAAQLSCKATSSCVSCNACLLEETLSAWKGRIFYESRLTGLKPAGDGHVAEIVGDAAYLRADKCVDCGLCHRICPHKDRAIVVSRLGLGPKYWLNPEECDFFRSGDCRRCADACPTGAIRLDRSETVREEEVQGLILAAGFTPFDPSLKTRFGHGRFPNVVSALELDRMLRWPGPPARPSDGLPPERIAFIQCVGSRDKSLARDYCSRICCGYALRMSGVIEHRYPDTRISIFYMDIQSMSRGLSGYFRDLRPKIELIQGIPGEISETTDHGLEIPHMDSLGRRTKSIFDLVVLSVGLGPPSDDLIELLGLRRNGDGFPRSDPDRRIFVAGSASGPMNIAESRVHARAVGAEAAERLGAL